MNSLRKVLGFLLAGLMLGAFAMPASAASDKTYTTTGFPTSLNPGQTWGPQTVGIQNNSPITSSNFNSFTLLAPAGIRITDARLPAGATYSASPNPFAITQVGGRYMVTVTNISPAVKKPATFQVSLTLVADSVCSASGGAWDIHVWTGSSPGNGVEFTPEPNTYPRTTISVGTGACSYTTVAPTSYASGQTNKTLSVTFANLGATTDLPIKSLQLSVAGTGLTINGVLNSGVTKDLVSASSVKISGISIAGGSSFTLNLDVTTSKLCGTSALTWTPQAYSGVYSGALTLKTTSPTNLSTTINGDVCSLSITAPKSAAVNVGFPVTVNLTGGPGGAKVTLSSSCSYSGGGDKTATGYSVTFDAFTITEPNVCTITASADQGYASASITSFKVYKGVLDCGDALINTNDPGVPAAGVNQSTGLSPTTGLPVPGWAAGSRGLFDKDGPCAGKVDYTFTNNVLGGNSTTLTWDVATVPGAAFKYTINWRPEYVGTTGMPIQRTYVQWFGLNAPSAPVLGRACIAQNQNPTTKDFLPRPYGTLASNDSLGTTIYVTADAGATVPTPPFAITIGKERLQVTSIDSTDPTKWTVIRGDGSTPVPPTGKPLGTYVMSNPLPLYLPTGATIPVQMEMCIADEGFTIVPAGSNDCPVTGTPSPAVTLPMVPTACAIVTTTLYDIGDGTGVRAP